MRTLYTGLGILALTTAAYAQTNEPTTNHLADKLSAHVALTSDYVFRGISQSDESIVLQGGIRL